MNCGFGFEYCVYITPCGYCSKFDKWCEKNNPNRGLRSTVPGILEDARIEKTIIKTQENG